MYVRYLSICLVSALMLASSSAWAQVDTSEGGGSANEQQDMLNDLLGRVQALEANQARSARREIDTIKEEMREVRLIETHHRKLLKLEGRIQKLEARVDAIIGKDPNASKAPSNESSSGKLPANDVPANGAKRSDSKQSSGKLEAAPAKATTRPQQAAQSGGSSARSEQGRLRRYQGRWWYWLPSGQWTYWTGERWAPWVAASSATP